MDVNWRKHEMVKEFAALDRYEGSVLLILVLVGDCGSKRERANGVELVSW